jgi:acetolactate decarboxylase
MGNYQVFMMTGHRGMEACSLNNRVLTRRNLLHAGIKGCATCAAISLRLASSHAATATEIDGKGYALRFIGNQREAMMMGKRAATLDLRTLKGRPHLYGLGPLEWLSGEVTIADQRPSLTRIGPDQKVQVTESYDAGVSFFVWAEVPAWETLPIPIGVDSVRDLEEFVGEAGKRSGLTQAFPFLITGSAETVNFHVGNATPETPPGMEAALRTSVPFTLRRQQATYVGFWSNQHHGVFTHADQDIHVHLQTPDNKISGHVDAVRFGGEMQLSLPKA